MKHLHENNLNKKNLFSSLALSLSLLQVLEELGFKTCTPIQAESIPFLLEGKDLIGQSKTGSGKTAAYSLPILEKIRISNSARHLQSLILCPTRELCTQVAREIRRLGRKMNGLNVLILSGGQPIRPQINALRKGAHIVVGTPGRILDHLGRGTLDLRSTRTLVLDEADRMLDMGFQEDMNKILDQVPPSSQKILFSATFPPKIESLSQFYQHDPIRVVIESTSENAPSIRQIACETDSESKFPTLFQLLQKYQPESGIIFCNLKATVIDLTRSLLRAGISAACIHGDLEQFDRDRVMAKFRNQSTRLLIATDVAARGIDIDNLDIVINFDLPLTVDTYIHRIGRTGRAGKKGVSLSLYSPHEKKKLQTIEDETGKAWEYESTRLSQDEAQRPSQMLPPSPKMATLSISGGRKEKMRPGDILGALTGDAGRLKGSDIGKIEIHDHFSYVAVSKHLAHTAVERLRTGHIKGRKFRISLVV